MQQRRRASIVPVPGASIQQSASAPRFSEAELATFAEIFALFAAPSSGEVQLAGACSFLVR
jgi:hypothetical protein